MPHPHPPADSEAEPDTEPVAQSSPARKMAAILLTIATAVLIWPVLLHQPKTSIAKFTPPTSSTIVAAHKAESQSPRMTTTGSWLPTESNWGEQLRSGDYWSKHAFGGTSWSQPRNGLTRADRVSIPWPEMRRQPEGFDGQPADRSDGKTYRTMCVRLCDGFYWPVSFSVTKDRFEVDASTCARSCGGVDQAKLFVYRNPGSDIESMEDLDGQAYRKLKTAFLFKTKYEASCKCRPDPWDQASVDRHQSYALAEQARQGNRVAASQLQELRTKIRNEEKVSAQGRAAKAKSQTASKSLADKGAASDGNKTAVPPKATIAAPVAPPNVIRGTDKRSGHIRTARQPDPDIADADDDEPPRSVRVRLGNRSTTEVPVRSQRRNRKAAEAAGSQIVKQ